MSETRTDSQSELVSFSKYRNVGVGASIGSLSGAAAVSLGAAIQKHDIRAEAINTLVGGAIIGAVAGAVGPHLLASNESSTSVKMCIGLLELGLDLMVLLASPSIGNAVLHTSTNWSDVVVDKLIGGGVVAAGVCGLCSCVVGPAVMGLFKQATEETTAPNNIQNNPVISVEHAL